jgi:hypothetical protein
MTRQSMTNGLFSLLGAGILAVAGCGSSESSCPDGGCLDAAPVTDTAPSGDALKLYTLASGSYTVVSASMVMDGCKIGVDKTVADMGVIGASFPLTLDNTTGQTTLGNLQGNPMVYSLGSGKIGANMGTLSMETDITAEAPSMCKLHRKVDSVLTLTGDLQFNLAVTRTDSMRTNCPEPLPDPTCTSTFTWSFVKAATPDGGI